MKSFCILFAMIFISLLGISQVNFLFPGSNAIWVNTDYEVVWNDTIPIPTLRLRYVENYCMNEQDTVINSISYSQIFICDSAYKGAIRETNHKVYFVPKDSLQEFLLYDFSVSAGDSLYNVYMEYTYNQGGFLADIAIHQIDSVIINDEYRKLINVESSFWIEGIGCQQGLFVHPFGNVSNAFHELHCMSKSDTILYPEYSIGSCDLTVGIDELNHKEPTMLLYPNPTEKNLYIGFSDNSKIEEIKVFNQFGQVVLIKNKWQNTIDVSSLKTGLYIIEVMTQNSRYTERIIKK